MELIELIERWDDREIEKIETASLGARNDSPSFLSLQLRLSSRYPFFCHLDDLSFLSSRQAVARRDL